MSTNFSACKTVCSQVIQLVGAGMALLVSAITAAKIGCAWRLAHALVLNIPALPLQLEWTVTLIKR